MGTCGAMWANIWLPGCFLGYLLVQGSGYRVLQSQMVDTNASGSCVQPGGTCALFGSLLKPCCYGQPCKEQGLFSTKCEMCIPVTRSCGRDGIDCCPGLRCRWVRHAQKLACVAR